jgi:hypothetical protein
MLAPDRSIASVVVRSSSQPSRCCGGIERCEYVWTDRVSLACLSQGRAAVRERPMVKNVAGVAEPSTSSSAGVAAVFGPSS